ncbi:MAG: stage II sporulation protein R [Clostridia bacterium]|nr:stage II sporulation protein R [Clostridia bacterium]
MKKFCISFFIVAIIILSIIGITLPQEKVNEEYLRIHIRADSNLENAQAVKYKVKDNVVQYLTPFIAECDTKQKAENMLISHLENIKKVCDDTLKQNGFSYTASVKVKTEEFPTRVYGDLELEKGFYQALIIELGSGEGDNWWCVVYPPLCFVGEGEGYVYKSKIKQIIDGFYNKEKNQ